MHNRYVHTVCSYSDEQRLREKAYISKVHGSRRKGKTKIEKQGFKMGMGSGGGILFPKIESRG